MSCFSVRSRRLLPARKAWKLFTAKLQSKLLRFKAIRKPKNRIKAASKSVFWPVAHKKRTAKVRRFRFQKRNPPLVYIDQLFVESVSVLKKEHVQESTSAAAATAGNHKFSTYYANKSKVMTVPAGIHTADDMWESLVLASPQMHGINERAEEFITRFRAEMHLQEISSASPSL